MDRTPGALFNTREIVAGERFKYSPNVRKLIGCPGSGVAPDLDRLTMHSCCNTVLSYLQGFQRPWQSVVLDFRPLAKTPCRLERDNGLAANDHGVKP